MDDNRSGLVYLNNKMTVEVGGMVRDDAYVQLILPLMKGTKWLILKYWNASEAMAMETENWDQILSSSAESFHWRILPEFMLWG